MTIIKHKDAYIKSFKDAILGNELNVSYPSVSSSSPYYTQLNEEQEVSTFAYNVGKVVKDNISVGSGSGSSGGSGNTGSTDDYDNRYALKDHNHDNIYAKITHDHDGRYYTKTETDSWRNQLINGNLLFNKINANHIQAGTIVAGSSIIANGAIGSAQINKVSADKLDAGVIDTSKITISGSNSNLLLKGNRLQVFQGIGNNQKERVSLGDVNNDGSIYGLRVRGADGQTILYDENGVYNEGITDGAITNEKIGDGANIDGAKLNISSVINNINKDGTGTIHGTKIDIDGETLNSKVFKIESNQNKHSETIERQQSEINQNKENINLKVGNQKYEEDMSSMTSRLEKTEADINILNDNISLSVKKTELENQIKEVKDFVSDEIGDISVGGANYLNNSAPRKAIVDELITWDKTLNGTHRLVYWQDYNNNVSNPTIGYHPHIDLTTFHFPCIAFINKNAKFNLANRDLFIKQNISNEEGFIIQNETYTISFDACSDTPLFSFHGGLYHKNLESSAYNYHSGRMDIQINKEDINTWKRYSFTFTTHKGLDLNGDLAFIINCHNNPEGSGYVKNIKLEKGNVPTQHTPSQFDVDDSLDDIVESMKDYTNSSIKDYSSSIDIKLDSITQNVSSVESKVDKIDGEVKSQETRLKNAEQKVTSDAIIGVVESSSFIEDINGEIKEVSKNVSKVEQTANSITSTVSDLSGKYTSLKQTVESIDLTGVVTFSDLKTSGKTVINGENIDTTNLRVKGELISGQINGVDGIKFDEGAVVTSYPHGVARGLGFSAPNFKFMSGDVGFDYGINNRSNKWSLDKNGALNCASSVITGQASIGSVSTNGLTVYGSTSLSGSLYTSGSATIGTTLNVRNNAIYGMNNLVFNRGSVYIPNFSSSTTMDYMGVGYGYLGCTDGGVFHLITRGTSRNIQIGSNQSLYLPHSGGSVSTEMIRLGGGIVACPSSGSFHFITASGSTTPLYAGTLYSRSVLSVSESETISDKSVFDDIKSINVVNTSKGLRLYNPVSNVDLLEESTNAVKTTYNEEKNELETSIDFTTAIAVLWKAVQELKEENKELKKLIKGVE